MGRSLIASPEGIKRAKLALKRRNLTQKALAYELAMPAASRFASTHPGQLLTSFSMVNP